ncbi:WD40-repeat-containing domain protein [Gautieria morchelliformis]|nr:WD40-repeat-containing domain protein [Gautieria morchelliformis]
MSSKRIRVYPPNPSTTRGTSTKLGSSGDKIIYAHGKSVVIRDLANAANDVVYSGHVHPTTAARISPSGYYVASADTQGNVRVWDAVGEDQVLKAEYKVLGGKINDLSWDGESKRIIAVGDGREKFGHVFQFDTGSSAGEIVGHAKALNAVAIRQLRPFRAATAGDDGLIVFHTGTPYKYEKTLKAHTNFVHSVAYAGSGAHFVSVGADAKVFLWDGVSGERAAEFVDSGDGAHKGSIYAGAWAPDSKSIVTSSADCTVKLWDVKTRKATTTWTVGSGVEHQQMGNTWTGNGSIVSMSMGGVLNVFDPREGAGPVRMIHGPQKAITSSATSISSSTFFAGSADGRVHSYPVAEIDAAPRCERVSGPGHTNLVSGIASAGTTTWSVGFDDCVRELSVQDGVDAFSNMTYGPTASQPKSVATSTDGHVFVAETGHVEVLRSGQRVCAVDAQYGAISVDVSAGIVAVGGEDAKVHLYNWNSNGTLTEAGLLEGSNKGPVSSLAFAPGGALLAAGDSTGKIVVYDVKERKASISRWTFHNSRIHSLAWTTDGAHVASGSLDTHVYVWSIAKPMRNIAIKNAGPGGVWGVRWVPGADSGAEGKLLSAGADGAVRMWGVVFHV